MSNDFSALEQMLYSGRGVVVGMTPTGEEFIAYWLTGRSTSSQARELLLGKNAKNATSSGTVRTSPTNKEELEKGSPALLLYPAVVPVAGGIVASNGAQTKLMYSAMRDYEQALTMGEIGLKQVVDEAFAVPFFEYDQKDDVWIDITTFEPDAPNFTPRINAIVRGRDAVIYLIKRDQEGEKEVQGYEFTLVPGIGRMITTYKGGNEDPLLPFEGEPHTVRIDMCKPDEIANAVYDLTKGAIPDKNFRVATVVAMMRKTESDPVTRYYDTAIVNRSVRGA